MNRSRVPTLILGIASLTLISGVTTRSEENATSAPSPATQQSAPAATAPAPDPREAAILGKITQLTSGFDKAGEAYFSHDMKWIVFQASPHGMPHYQMYVAPLLWQRDQITGLGKAIRVSPDPSRNTCGFFSPDGNSLIFASTAGKEDPTVKEGGYQREGRDYRWAFPAGMEIFKADQWKQEVEASLGKELNLARTPVDRE